MERFLHTVEPFVKEIVKQESGAEAVFVHVTKLQCATPQSQHLQLCPCDKVTHCVTKLHDKNHRCDISLTLLACTRKVVSFVVEYQSF